MLLLKKPQGQQEACQCTPAPNNVQRSPAPAGLCAPAEGHHVVCGLGSHVGVAVPVATHPRAKLDGGGVQGQLAPCVLLERSRQAAQEGGHSCPQRLLHHMQPTTRLCTAAAAAAVAAAAVGEFCTAKHCRMTDT
jgi:hypothetical protein